jgi:branched-subunit amino acid aminotransferase/4-amino-4-deoxychorismate lyase
VLVFLNGQFVPEEHAVVSVFDRGFLYGDGLFETVLVCNGKPFRWAQHLERLQRGADFLNIKLPFAPDALRDFAGRLITKNQLPDALLRLTLSRGVGPRGYSPKGAEQPVLVMSLNTYHHPVPLRADHPLPSDGRGAGGEGSFPRWKLITSTRRLPANEPLAQFKTGNKLAQVLARAEADAAGADEALLLNTDGFGVEGTSSNLFWIQRGVVCTPPLASGILAGVTRAIVLELCGKLGLAVQETNITPDELRCAEGVFLTLTSPGVVVAAELDGTPLAQSPLVEKLRLAYAELVCAESSE